MADHGPTRAQDKLPAGQEAQPGTGLDRATALAAGPPKIPGKALAGAAACIVVLALGGVGLDHLFPGPVGAAPVITAPAQYPPPFVAGASSQPGGSSGGRQIGAPADALMGLQALAPVAAPGFSLTDQGGHRVALGGLRGKVVVLSFFDSSCDDICSVLGAELAGAYKLLGAGASGMDILTVNTDPLALGTGAGAALAGSGLGRVRGWHFLNGPLAKLGPVWKAYGVSIDVQRSTRSVSHNDLLYFIDPAGRLRYRATPFADEQRSGLFSLPRAEEKAWAEGIADRVRSLSRGMAK